MHSSVKQYPDLKQQHLDDLSRRAMGGIVIYPVVWFVTAIWAEIPQNQASFFFLNSVILLTISGARALHTYLIFRKKFANAELMYQLLVTFILLGAMHWGILSAWVIFIGDYPGLHYPYMVILAAFALGGTSVLSISRVISIAFPLLIFIPSLAIGLRTGGTENFVMFLLAVISLVYVLVAAKATHKDYYAAVDNHRLAIEKAFELEKLSLTDQLTGLNNRMYFNQKYTEAWDQCCRSKLPLSVMLIDLDHFKKINDTYGHIAGDDCLKLAALALKSVIFRNTDTLARYGGEEFVVILPFTNKANSLLIAEKLRLAISNIEVELNSTPVILNCSVGLASAVPNHEDDPENLLISADNALYKAKDAGRNQVMVAD